MTSPNNQQAENEREIKLKDCPFCGSNEVDREGGLAQNPDGTKYSFPVCDECGASCDSVELWNRRPSSKVEQVVTENEEALKNALEKIEEIEEKRAEAFQYARDMEKLSEQLQSALTRAEAELARFREDRLLAIKWMDSQKITSENIGEIRRMCFLPWQSSWNSFIRDETGSRENKK